MLIIIIFSAGLVCCGLNLFPLPFSQGFSREVWIDPAMMNSNELMIRSLYSTLLRSSSQVSQVFAGDSKGRMWAAGKRSNYEYASFINTTGFSSTGDLPPSLNFPSSVVVGIHLFLFIYFFFFFQL